MKEQIKILTTLGMSTDDAISFIKKISEIAYEDGYDQGIEYEPSIIGESLGKSGIDFYDWFQIQLTSLL